MTRVEGRAPTAAVDRASPGDLAYLAMDTGPVPEQLAAVLELDDELDLGTVRGLIARRIPAVPRMRQVLSSTPFGCGGPVWVDDPDLDLDAQVTEVRCRPPGDEDALLAEALDVVMTPLPRTAPLWRAVLVTGLPGGRSALILVLHHVLSDGVGGLSILASLVDPGPPDVPTAVPQPAPGRRVLLVDAFRRRARALRGVAAATGALRRSMRAGGGLHPPQAEPCSLVRPTGPRRGLAVVRTDLDAVREGAHRAGATTNDAVLVAVAAALRRVLAGRGEALDHLVVTVPVSGRTNGGASEVGNQVSPLIVPVPTTGTLADRLAEVHATVAAGKEAATAPPPIALLGWLFRPLARHGGYRWYMTRQHRFHTLVSHVRGPDRPLTFGGATIGSAIPVGVAEGGNTTVYFEVLSYAGALTVSVLVDPDHVPDLPVLVSALGEELARLSAG